MFSLDVETLKHRVLMAGQHWWQLVQVRTIAVPQLNMDLGVNISESANCYTKTLDTSRPASYRFLTHFEVVVVCTLKIRFLLTCA